MQSLYQWSCPLIQASKQIGHSHNDKDSSGGENVYVVFPIGLLLKCKYWHNVWLGFPLIKAMSRWLEQVDNYFNMQIEYTCTEFSCRIPFGCCVQRNELGTQKSSGQGVVIWAWKPTQPPLFWNMFAAVDEYGIELSVYCSRPSDVSSGKQFYYHNSNEGMKSRQEQLLTLSTMALALEWDVFVPKHGLLLL